MAMNKNRLIWIIEDEYYDYSILRKLLKDHGYLIFPDCSSAEDYFDYFQDELFSSIKSQNLDQYVYNKVKELDLLAVICDIKLGQDDVNSGEKIIQYLNINMFNKKYFNHTVPIFALTKYSNKGINAVRNGAHYFSKFFFSSFSQDNIEGNKVQQTIFIESLKYWINESENEKRLIEVLRPSFEECQKLMLKNNEILESRFDNIKLTLQSTNENVLSKFNSSFGLLLQLSLEQLKYSDGDGYESFVKSFDQELINEIGKENYDIITEQILNLNETWSGSFSQVLQNGSIEDAISYLGSALTVPTGGISSLIAFSINLLIKNFK